MHRACSTHKGGQKYIGYMILIGKPQGNRALKRPRRRWENNIKMYLRETGTVAWIRLMWLRIGTRGEFL
jgi:hypothetical protein